MEDVNLGTLVCVLDGWSMLLVRATASCYSKEREKITSPLGLHDDKNKGGMLTGKYQLDPLTHVYSNTPSRSGA